MREPRLGCGEFLGGSVGVVSVLGPGLLFARWTDEYLLFGLVLTGGFVNS
jgi:hypothetical protein